MGSEWSLAPRDPRLVVVGYGGWGRRCHCCLIRSTPGLALQGVVSSDAEKRKAVENDEACRAYDSLEAALDDPDVDGAVVAPDARVEA